MTPFLRPMLASSLLKPNDPHTDESILKAMESLKYPVLASLKKDGIRAIRLDDLRSRTLNLIPNISIRMRSMKLPYGFDCELWNPELSYDEVESIVMSEEHEDSEKIEFHVLDWYGEVAYIDRLNAIARAASIDWLDTKYLSPSWVNKPAQLFQIFKQSEEQEGEGICFRLPDSPYKQGRSTLREQYLVKLARFIFSEVTIIGYKERQHNSSGVKRNKVGLMDRSSYKHKQRGMGMLGAFICKNKEGLEFDVGTGTMTDDRKADLYLVRDTLIGKQIVIKSKAHGMKVKPRSPQYWGFRTPIDI